MVFTVYKRGDLFHYRRQLAPGVAKCSNSGWPTCLGAVLTAERVAKCYHNSQVIISEEQITQIFAELQEDEPERDYHPFDGDIAADLASAYTPSDIAFFAQLSVERELFAQGMGD